MLGARGWGVHRAGRGCSADVGLIGRREPCPQGPRCPIEGSQLHESQHRTHPLSSLIFTVAPSDW